MNPRIAQAEISNPTDVIMTNEIGKYSNSWGVFEADPMVIGGLIDE
jgi:hypothetical protein